MEVSKYFAEKIFHLHLSVSPDQVDIIDKTLNSYKLCTSADTVPVYNVFDTGTVPVYNFFLLSNFSYRVGSGPRVVQN